MSGAALGWAKSVRAPNAMAKAVLVSLADYADQSGIAWPAIPRLAQEVQASDRTVQRALRSLEEVGLIFTEKRDRQDGGQTSNGYRLAMPPGDNLTPAPVTSCHPPGDTHVTPPVTPVSPPYEPPLELKASDEASTRAGSDFDQFWAAYPAKVGKKAALRAWQKAKDRPPLPEVLLALDRYRRTKPADRDWCHPSTWLNEGRWEDGEIAPTGGNPNAVPPAAVFDGPPGLRAAIVREIDEDYACRWLDHYCRWRAEDHTLVARNSTIADRLRRDLSTWLISAKVRIEVDGTTRPTLSHAA